MELGSFQSDDHPLLHALAKRIATDSSPAIQICSNHLAAPVGFNLSAAGFFGQDFPQAWDNLLDGESLAAWRQQLSAACLQRTSVLGVFRLTRFDGKARAFVLKSEPRFGPDGRFLGHITSGLDITGVELSPGPSAQPDQDDRETAKDLYEHLVSTATVIVSCSDIVEGIADSPNADQMLHLVTPKLSRAAAELRQLLASLNLVSRTSDSPTSG